METLEVFEAAVNARDATDLENLFSDNFTFYFDDEGEGTKPGGFIIPDSWGKYDFVAACGEMLTRAYAIDLKIDTTTLGEPGEDNTTYQADHVYIDMLVMVDSLNGYQAQGFCDFRFVNVGSGGNDDWVISDWWDDTAFGRGFETEPPSFGKILAVFM